MSGVGATSAEVQICIPPGKEGGGSVGMNPTAPVPSKPSTPPVKVARGRYRKASH